MMGQICPWGRIQWSSLKDEFDSIHFSLCKPISEFVTVNSSNHPLEVCKYFLSYIKNTSSVTPVQTALHTVRKHCQSNSWEGWFIFGKIKDMGFFLPKVRVHLFADIADSSHICNNKVVSFASQILVHEALEPQVFLANPWLNKDQKSSFLGFWQCYRICNLWVMSEADNEEN